MLESAIFIFKKIVGGLLAPMSLGLAVSAVGLLLLWFSSRQLAGRIIITCGFLLLFLLSIRPVADLLLDPIEDRYPVYEGGAEVQKIVVLGGGRTVDPELPLMSQLSSASRSRLMEGIRLYRTHPGTEMILTGKDIAKAAADVAIALGVPEADIIPLDSPKDTKDEARAVRGIINDNESFLLVTSASHMYRAMALFRKQGLDPIPAPTDHMVLRDRKFRQDDLFPSSWEMRKSQRAIYEILGTLWARLRGQIE